MNSACQRNLFFSEVPQVDLSGFGNKLFNYSLRFTSNVSSSHCHTDPVNRQDTSDEGIFQVFWCNFAALLQDRVKDDDKRKRSFPSTANIDNSSSKFGDDYGLDIGKLSLQGDEDLTVWL